MTYVMRVRCELGNSKERREGWEGLDLEKLRSRKNLLCGHGESGSVVSDSLRPHGLYSPWNPPGQNTGVGSRPLLQGIFPTQGSNSGLPRCRWILYQLSHQWSPKRWTWHGGRGAQRYSICDLTEHVKNNRKDLKTYKLNAIKQIPFL